MKTEDRVRMTLRLDPEDDERLAQYANTKGMTKSEAIRRLLRLSLDADEVLGMEADPDDPMYHVIRSAHSVITEGLLESTSAAKGASNGLTFEQVTTLQYDIVSMRKRLEQYEYELNRIGNNINQIARKYNATDDLEVKGLADGFRTMNKNMAKTISFLQRLKGKVDDLWDMVR